MSGHRSTERISETGAPGTIVTTGPRRKAGRFALDFATWRAHLAAPGSTFAAARSASARIVRLDPLIRNTEPAEVERRTA